jgi:hypothetical protein
VLTYDIRNHGNSSAANGGLSGIGQWEWRDCVGVKKFVDNHPTLSKMKVALYSQCMGGNSQYHAIHRRPDLFENLRCMVSPMVVSMSAIYDAFSELQGVRQYQELIDLELLKMGAFVARQQGEGTAVDRGRHAAIQGWLQLLWKASGKNHRLLRQAPEVSIRGEA